MVTMRIYEQHKEWAIKAAAGIAMCILCYATLIQPIFRDIVILRRNIMDSQKRSELYRKVQGLKESLASRESVLATITERSQLLGKISDIAGKTQIHVEKLTPRTESVGNYIKLRMEMEGQGSFFSLVKFLQAVEKINAAIKVGDISLLGQSFPNSQEGEYSLQIQLMFETFLKQKVGKSNV